MGERGFSDSRNGSRVAIIPRADIWSVCGTPGKSLSVASPTGEALDFRIRFVGHMGALTLVDANILLVYGDYRHGAAPVQWNPGGDVTR